MSASTGAGAFAVEESALGETAAEETGVCPEAGFPEAWGESEFKVISKLEVSLEESSEFGELELSGSSGRRLMVTYSSSSPPFFSSAFCCSCPPSELEAKLKIESGFLEEQPVSETENVRNPRQKQSKMRRKLNE